MLPRFLSHHFTVIVLRFHSLFFYARIRWPFHAHLYFCCALPLSPPPKAYAFLFPFQQTEMRETHSHFIYAAIIFILQSKRSGPMLDVRLFYCGKFSVCLKIIHVLTHHLSVFLFGLFCLLFSLFWMYLLLVHSSTCEEKNPCKSTLTYHKSNEYSKHHFMISHGQAFVHFNILEFTVMFRNSILNEVLSKLGNKLLRARRKRNAQ